MSDNLSRTSRPSSFFLNSLIALAITSIPYRQNFLMNAGINAKVCLQSGQYSRFIGSRSYFLNNVISVLIYVACQSSLHLLPHTQQCSGFSSLPLSKSSKYRLINPAVFRTIYIMGSFSFFDSPRVRVGPYIVLIFFLFIKTIIKGQKKKTLLAGYSLINWLISASFSSVLFTFYGIGNILVSPS